MDIISSRMGDAVQSCKQQKQNVNITLPSKMDKKLIRKKSHTALWGQDAELTISSFCAAYYFFPFPRSTIFFSLPTLSSSSWSSCPLGLDLSNASISHPDFLQQNTHKHSFLESQVWMKLLCRPSIYTIWKLYLSQGYELSRVSVALSRSQLDEESATRALCWNKKRHN